MRASTGRSALNMQKLRSRSRRSSPGIISRQTSETCGTITIESSDGNGNGNGNGDPPAPGPGINPTLIIAVLALAGVGIVVAR